MSEARKIANLTVATDRGVEVEVYDHQFQLVGCATDGWSGVVPTGIYNVRFKAGGQVTEQLVHVPADGATVQGTVDVWRSASPSAEIAGFGSAAAIPDREARQSELAVKRWGNAAEVGRREGARSMVFVFAAAPAVRTKEDPARTVQAFAFTPATAPIAWHHEDRDFAEGWSTRVLYDPPPVLRLRMSNGRNRIEQTVPAIDGYCTAVFLEYGRTTATRWGISGSTTTILANRLDRAPKEATDHHRFADLALRALEHGGRPISENAGKCLSVDPAVDPLTRLYLTAHLFSRWSPDWCDSPGWIRELALTALDRLAQEASQIPDVRLLQAWATTRGFGEFPILPVDYPPMLRSVWTAGVQASVQKPELIADDVPAARAGRQRCGAGPWLAWRAKPPVAVRRTVAPGGPVSGDLMGIYRSALEAVQSAEIVKELSSVPRCIEIFEQQAQVGGSSLTPTEMNLLSMIADTIGAREGDLQAPLERQELHATIEQTAMALGQGADSLGHALSGLVDKLR